MFYSTKIELIILKCLDDTFEVVHKKESYRICVFKNLQGSRLGGVETMFLKKNFIWRNKNTGIYTNDIEDLINEIKKVFLFESIFDEVRTINSIKEKFTFIIMDWTNHSSWLEHFKIKDFEVVNKFYYGINSEDFLEVISDDYFQYKFYINKK